MKQYVYRTQKTHNFVAIT